MSKEISIRQWLENYKLKKYDAQDKHTQIEAGWYDWFCSDKALAGKTRSLAAKLKQIIGSDKFDIDKTYVFFKNNCPGDGRLYDDFRICRLDSEDSSPLYTVTPSCGHNHILGISEVWGQENGFSKAIVSGTWQEVKDWFMQGSKVLKRGSVLTLIGKCIDASNLAGTFEEGVEYVIIKDLDDMLEVENALGQRQTVMKNRFKIRKIWQ